MKTRIMSCLSKTVLVLGLLSQSGNTMEVASAAPSPYYELIMSIEALKYRIENHRWPGDDNFQPRTYEEEVEDYSKYNLPPPSYEKFEDEQKRFNSRSKYAPIPYYPISYAEFVHYQEQGVISKDEAEELTNHAYTKGNPILFHRADEEVGGESYCLNFLWINARPRFCGKIGCHLMGEDDALFKEKILNPILDWQSKQPLANINFWYDDDMIYDVHYMKDTSLIMEVTLNKLQEEGVCLDKLTFMNIRHIKEICENERLFSDIIPVYFRVDLAKVLTAQFIMTHSEDIEYVVNCDSDIVAVTREQLFDHKTMWELKEVGYAFGSAGGAEEENSFIMLSKKLAFDVHEEIMIKKSIKDVLVDGRKSEQTVFYNYKPFKYMMHKEYEKRIGFPFV